jgi:branched-chain amino acid transport system permease protein
MLLQLLANGFVMGCSYAMVALGFALIYNTTRIFHFAHGGIYTIGAYWVYTLFNLWHLPLGLSCIIAAILTAGCGFLLEEYVYYPFSKKNANPMILMLVSLGIYIVIINLIAMIFGNATKIINPGVQTTYSLGNVILTQIQLVTIAVFLVIFLALILLLNKTNLGRMIRAMRDDAVLVSILGINPRYIRRLVFILGSLLAGVASILSGVDVGTDPNVGMSALAGAVAVIIGGIGLFEGAVLGAMILGLLQSIAVWKLSARWVDTVTFFLLISFLVFRPQGLLGTRKRIEESHI